MKKYQSITTPGLMHDAANLLLEVYFLNKYNIPLPPYSWRKGAVLSKEWPQSLKLIKALLSRHKLPPEKIAWYLYTYGAVDIEPKNFGLHVWKIQTQFKTLSLEKLSSFYREKFKFDPQVIISDYVLKPTVKKKSLFDILGDLDAEEEKDTR